MRLETTNDQTDSAQDDAEVAYVIRVATAYFLLSHGEENRLDFAKRIVAALDADSRVTIATSPDLDEAWSPELTVYTPMQAGEEIATSGALEGTRHAHVQMFSDPIAFQLRVPAKNQPKVFESDEIPSEDYFVLWNGATLLVAWEQRAEDRVGASGGHIVEEVLEQAATTAGGDLMIQACNPQCKYVFLHTAIRVVIEPGSETDWSTSLAGNHADLLEIVLDEGDSLIDAALSVWYRLVGPLREFAGVKNRGRQILELEQIARADLDGLNRLHHERASATQRRVGRRVAALWEFRSWRRTSRFYLARLWLALGTLERLRRAWRDDYLSFLRSIEEEHVQDLFTIDSYEEVRMIDELDLSLIESAVQHADDRLSSNILALATAGGAIAGAVVAGLISLH